MIEAYIFDIDGTLADCTHRLIHIDTDFGKKDWDTFYSLCSKDQPIEDVCRIYRELHADVICITGRTEKYREQTEQWLNDNDLPFHDLFMRPDGDHRPDYAVKQEIFEKHIKGKYKILGVFEDRDQVVKMWRELGLTCFQCCEGNY